jgi:small subunit ribosomal protein S20
MPNIKSAKKRVRLSEKWAAENRAARSKIRTAMKKVLQSTEPEAAEAAFRGAVKLLDRAGRTRLYHPNRSSRYKSRLSRHVASLS